jgi:general secretion pathway protein H
MTLIEITIVLVILAVAASGVSFGLGALTRSQLRSSCNKVIAAARFAYNRAVVNGVTTRLTFTLPAETFSIEEAHGRIVLANAKDVRRKGDGEGAVSAAGIDPWKAAEARIKDTYKPNLGASPFGAIGSSSELADGSSAKPSRYSNVPLGRGVRIVRLTVPHEVDPIEEGENGIYFFPGGQTEHAVIQLSDGGNTVYSIEIHPLTGRVTLHTEAYEPRALLDNADSDKDGSEVDEP